jgi:hypothetical protein
MADKFNGEEVDVEEDEEDSEDSPDEDEDEKDKTFKLSVQLAINM